MNTLSHLVCLSLLSLLCAPSPAPAQQADPGPAVDTRGPAANPGMKVTINDNGVQAPGYTFDYPGPAPGTWQGKWIGLPTSQPGEAALFRKEISLDQAPGQAPAWITASSHYILYINGRLAFRGPADQGQDFDRGTTDRWFYDCRDLAPLLHKGKNVLAAEVFGGDRAFLLQANLLMPGGRRSTIGTDETWRGTIADFLQMVDGHLQFDGGKEPVGWQTLDFDASGWPAAAITRGVRAPLVPSELPPLMEVRYPVASINRTTPGVKVPQKPFQDGRSILVTSNCSFAVHFDRVMAAYYGIAVRGGAGARIEIGASERNAPGHNRVVSLVLRDGLQYFESPELGSVGTINVIVSHVTTPVRILDVSADFSSQPVTYRGSFSCSDEYLNRVWKSCRWATQICLQTHHLDSPEHQEPISDYGDYLIEDLVGYYAFGGDPWLARQDLRKWAWIMRNCHYQTFHTSYALLWLQSLLNYYDYTGDRAFVQELAPYVHDLLDQFTSYIGKNGIISEAPNYMFMDWVEIAGFNCHHPPAVIGQGYMTAFYYQALEDARRAAGLTGDMARAQMYAALRTKIAAAYNRELWNQEKGLYLDGKPFQTSVKPNAWLPADRDIQTFSAQNNVLAVLYDLAPQDQQQAIIRQVMAQSPWNVRPYYMHFVLSAIAHAGVFHQYGTEWMRKWKIISETRTFYEMGNQGDLSHGWIATPLYQMSSQVLGVGPTAPGFQTLSIHPTLSDLSWARGVVPTPHGSVEVRWTRKGDNLALDVTIPAGARANIAIPSASPRTARISVNGKSLWKNNRPGKVMGIGPIHAENSAIQVSVPSGKYSFLGAGLGLPAPPAPSTPAAGASNTTVITPGSPLVVTTKTNPDSAAAFEADIVKDSLVSLGQDTYLSAIEENVAHTGGGGNADALRNSSTLNGAGQLETQDDGKTFRGYGNGSTLTFHLNTALQPAGYNLTRILTFAGHQDSRASQNYTVYIAFTADPTRFVKLVSASVHSDGGASELDLTEKDGGPLDNGAGCKAAGAAAVRFEFQDGSVESGAGLGFNVYREITIVGKPASPQKPASRR